MLDDDCLCNICQRGRKFDKILNHYLIQGPDRKFLNSFHEYLIKVEFDLENFKKRKFERRIDEKEY